MSDILMASFGIVTAIAVTLMLFTRNIMYAVFGLVIALMSIAGIYVLLSAEFVAVAQLMIYIGGVIVLLLFAVMLTQRTGERVLYASVSRKLTGPLMVALLLILLFPVLQQLSEAGSSGITGSLPASIPSLGFRLLTEMLIPMELLALLLLVVLIGAASIAGQFYSTNKRNR